MTRLLALVSAAALVVAIGVGVSAQGAKTMNAQGIVSPVTTTSLAVKGASESWTFTIDKDTEVHGQGRLTQEPGTEGGWQVVGLDGLREGRRSRQRLLSRHGHDKARLQHQRHRAGAEVTAAPR